MATASKAYQTVIAGRVREDEMPFFHLNKAVSPARVYYIVGKGGVTKDPSFKKEYMLTENVGKNTNRSTYVASATAAPVQVG